MRGSRATLVLCASAALLAACTSPSGHRVLTFFFDGVPPLQDPAAQADGARPGEPGGPASKIRIRDHGPYAAKLCDGCHESGTGNALIVPASELCQRCHSVGSTKKFVHGPLNAGGCVVCHDPHQSPNPYLLVSAPDESCVRCHDLRSLRAVDGHEAGAAACTACHDAHVSDRPYLLR
ncbi:MAG TPA: cytochrome c3 family protein [Thermoanaerobaculia bacterium]|jgi:predicted CXXCH cytochrome family protein